MVGTQGIIRTTHHVKVRIAKTAVFPPPPKPPTPRTQVLDRSKQPTILIPCYNDVHIVNKKVNYMILSPTIDELIEKNPQLRSGRPIISGTGTTVRAIVGLYKLGLSAEEIATQLPHLHLAQIYAALTYYHLHVNEIEADIEADSENNLKRAAQIN